MEKIEKNAKAANLTPKEYVDGIVAKFKEMAHRQYKFQDMDIINDLKQYLHKSIIKIEDKMHIILISSIERELAL